MEKLFSKLRLIPVLGIFIITFLSNERVSAQAVATSSCAADCFTFKGKIDYKAIGNSMNYSEDQSNCGQKPNSAAALNMPSGASVAKAYLQWSGSGGIDYSVTLNGQTVSAQKTFSQTVSGANFLRLILM